MKREILIVLVSEYADWECAFISAVLNGGLADADPEGNIQAKYLVRTLGLTKEPAVSFGGLKTIIDYDIHSYPKDYEALILIGGTSWKTEKVNLLLPIVEEAINNNKVVGAICDASLFLGINGFLNEVQHTSNTLDGLSEYPNTEYTNPQGYKEQQAVSDKKIITANGTAYLEFTKELLIALEAYSSTEIEKFYQLYKLGYHTS